MSGQAVILSPMLDVGHMAKKSAQASWLLMGGFCALTAGTTFFGPAAGVKILYTPIAFIVALLLIRYNPPLYVGFTWWITFLSPLVRRLVEYRIGYDAVDPILIAPLLVIGTSAMAAWRHVPKLGQFPLFPFALLFATVLYGFIVGLLRLGAVPPLYGVLSWLAPICFGFYMATQWRQYPRYRQVLERTFVVSTLLLGAYGVLQFVSPPPWDVYWIVAGGQSEQLSSKPFEVRVFGTLTSFGPFALVMMAGILICLSARSIRAKAVLPVGLLALLLSSVRTAWGGLLLALLIYFAYLPGRRGRPIIVIVALFGLILLAREEPFRSVIESRFRSFMELEQDQSYQARRLLFEYYSGEIAGNPVGAGVGSTGRGSSMGEGIQGPGLEHGLQDIFYSLGWLGGAVYCLAMAMLFARIVRSGEAHDDNFAKTARAVAVALLAMSLAGRIFVGVGGAMMWSFVGLQLAAQSFHAASGPDSALKRELT